MNSSPDDLQHRRTFVRVLVALFLGAALCVRVSAQSVVGPKGIAYEERTTDYFLADSFLNFDRPWLSIGPAWLMNAMPGSRLSDLRSPWGYDRNGDRIESVYRYASDVGTLANPYDVRLFNNVAGFVTGSGGTPKTFTPLIADATNSTKYWDTTGSPGNGVGGSATWNAQGDNFWSNANTGDTSLSAAGTTDAGIFAGNFGTITLGFSPTLASWTFNVSNYVIATTGATDRTITGAITLADGVKLVLAPTPGSHLNLNSGLSGGSGSQLSLGGTTSSSTDAVLVNLNANGASIAASAPIAIEASGPGFAGFLASGGSRTIDATITAYSPITMLFGAGSGATLNLNGPISAGQGGVRFALDGTDTASGTGVVVLGFTINNSLGPTVINVASGGSVMLGVNDALPTTTALKFGASSSSGNVGNLDMNGKNQTVASLESVTTGTHSITNTSATTSTLTIMGMGFPPASTVFSGVIGGTGANNIALVISSVTQTFSGGAANTYTGLTTLNSGTLNLNKTAGVDAIAGGGLTVNGGSVNLLASNQINNASTVTINYNGKLNIGANSDTVATVVLLNGNITGTTGVLTAGSYDLRAGDVSAILGGSGNLTVSGGGGVTLSGANTYTGTTTVNGGFLAINGNQSAATGNVAINNAGQLGGVGTIGGQVTVSGGATAGSGSLIYGGGGDNLFGTLTVGTGTTGAITLNNGSLIGVILGSSSLQHSTLALSSTTGQITFASNQVFAFFDLGATTITYQDIITGTNLTSLVTSGWTIDQSINPGWAGTFSLDASGNIDFTLTAMPEPSTWIGAGLALVAIGFAQRKRLYRLATRHAW